MAMQLSTRDLVAGYRKLAVLHGVDFHLNEGELVAVLGPNGAGKSTLIKALARVLPVMDGDITCDGVSAACWGPRQATGAGIGYVPQEQNVFSDLTVRENLSLSTKGDGGAVMAQVEERFPILVERAGQTAGSLSGGERQALAVSMALLGQPRILLLDEPTTGLSPLASESLTNWIVDIAGAGVSIVWIVEQNPEPVLAAADRAYVLSGGTVTFSGLASEISGERALSLALD
jgi:ABC-type branched-subunit amino acid transport system ATPase component